MQTDSTTSAPFSRSAAPASEFPVPTFAATARAHGERRSARRFVGPSLERGAALALARRVAIVAAAATTVVAVLALVGWQFDIDFLKRLGVTGFVMLPNTAVAHLLAGTSLLLLRARGSWAPARRVAAVLASIVLLIGLVTLLEWILRTGSSLDLLLFPEQVRRYPFEPPGRMAVNSAISFGLAGAALLLLPRRPALAQVLAMLGLLIALTAVIGYAFGFRTMYAIDRLAGMALLTALTFVLLQSGILFARPDAGFVALTTSDDLGALLSRRLLPAAAGVPVLLGFLWLALRRHEMLGREAGVGFFVVFTIILMTAVVLWTAHVVRTLDRERESLLESEARSRLEAERARAEAEAANRAKSDFLAVMSHELRTPLNAIGGYVQLLDLGLRGPVTEEQRRDFDRIATAQRHLTSLISDILNYVRLETGRIQYALRPVELGPALEAMHALVAPQMQSKGLAYELIGASRDVVVVADSEKLDQILVNLLTNAIKFTPSGGRITTEAVAEGATASIHVRDTGRGIEREKLDVIFEPFVQVDRRLTRDNDGVGLGLSISRELARGMGGDLTVQSEIGVGSTFTVTLPVATR